ncbi:MAG: hypothetical protein JO331_04245 [Verrucomicrobia bacterium]|nr:hypothetical protein [Verrucomicrobiota bacterium]
MRTAWKKPEDPSRVANASVYRRGGNVIANGSGGIQVGCGKGSLLLIQVQLERKRVMPATEFVRGFRCRPEPDSLKRRLCRKKTASSERAISITFSKSVLSWKRRKETNLLGPLTQGGLSL